MKALGNGPRYSIIPGDAATDRRLKGRDLQVLCVLGTNTDKQGWCRRSQVKLAKQIGCGRATVSRALERLTMFGYVEQTAVSGKSSTVPRKAGMTPDQRKRAAKSAREAGTIQAYRVVIDRHEEHAEDLPKNGQKGAHLERAGGAHLERAPLTYVVNDQVAAAAEPPQKNNHEIGLLDRLLAAAGRDRGTMPGPMADTTPIERLMGDGYDLDLDVLATIKAKSRTHGGRKAASWNYFAEAIRERRLRRTGGSPRRQVSIRVGDPEWVPLTAPWGRVHPNEPHPSKTFGDGSRGWDFDQDLVDRVRRPAASVRLEAAA